MQGALTQEPGFRDLISALSHLPSVAPGLGPGAKVHTVFKLQILRTSNVCIYKTIYQKILPDHFCRCPRVLPLLSMSPHLPHDPMLYTEKYKDFAGSSKHQRLKKKKEREREREKPQVSILNNVILTNNKQGGFICSLSPSA